MSDPPDDPTGTDPPAAHPKPRSPYITIKVKRETHALLVDLRRRVTLNGVGVLPAADRADYLEARAGLDKRQKQIGLAVLADLATRAYDAVVVAPPPRAARSRC